VTSVLIYAVPASGYYFANNRLDSWTFTRPHGLIEGLTIADG
jgi:hypothetical protein